jgi:hypothetical protein
MGGWSVDSGLGRCGIRMPLLGILQNSSKNSDLVLRSYLRYWTWLFTYPGTLVHGVSLARESLPSRFRYLSFLRASFMRYDFVSSFD